MPESATARRRGQRQSPCPRRPHITLRGMLRGLRASDASLIRQRTGGDMRLLLRIGALLESRLAFTELALERLAGDEPGRRLLADRRLGAADAEAFAALAAEAGVDDLRLLLDEGGAGSAWRIVALSDEIGNPLSPAAESAAQDDAGLPALIPTLAPALRAPVESLMQARADDQRAAALERLRYAAPPLALVGGLMPMLLGDGAEPVRERAVALVAACGAHALVIDLVRAMQRRDDAALLRLAPGLTALPPEQQDLALSAAIAQAGRGEASQGLIEVCTVLAPALAAHRQLERLLETLLPTAFSLVALVRAVQAADAERIRAALRRGLGYGPAQDAAVIVLLAAPDERGDAALLDRGIDLLLEPGEEPRNRMPLAAALRRLDADRTLAARLAAAGARIARSRDSSVHWLLAELCRDGAVDAASADALAEALRSLFQDAAGPHLIAALEQQLPVLLPCSAPARARLVEPLIAVVSRYRAERTLDLVTAALSGIGAPGLGAVWDAAENHPLPHVRLLMLSVLPGLVAASPADAAAAVPRLLGGLSRAEQADERGALVGAAARIATAPPLDGDAALCAAVDAAAAGLGHHAYDALGHLAAGAGCAPARRAAIVDALLIEACAELPDQDAPAVTDPATGELTYRLDERLAIHTEHVPLILAALARIGRSPACQAEVLARLVERLVGQWRRVASWSLVWGPGNVHALAATLADLAAAPGFPGPLRVRIAEALLPRISRLTVARALARVLILAEGPYLARVAARAAGELVRLATTPGEFADDERHELCEILSEFLAIPSFGPDADAVRRRLIGVLASMRDHVTSRARARLRFLAGGLAPDLAARLDWA